MKHLFWYIFVSYFRDNRIYIQLYFLRIHHEYMTNPLISRRNLQVSALFATFNYLWWLHVSFMTCYCDLKILFDKTSAVCFSSCVFPSNSTFFAWRHKCTMWWNNYKIKYWCDYLTSPFHDSEMRTKYLHITCNVKISNFSVREEWIYSGQLVHHVQVQSACLLVLSNITHVHVHMYLFNRF